MPDSSFVQRAELLADLGRYEEAAEELALADRDDVAAQTLLARIWLAAGSPKRALAAADAAVAAGPSNVPALVARGMALADLGRVDEAAQQAEQILRAGRGNGYACTSAAAILAGEQHYLPPLGVLTDGALVGYVALTAEPEFGRAQVEYLGVAPGHRGRGLATDLVRSAVHAAFRDPRVEVVSLTVSATNPAALRVYQKAGFVVERTMRCYRVVWPQPTG